MRLRLQSQHYGFNGIFFSATPESASVQAGETVDVAFVPQINEFRGEKSVQMNIQDIRPACKEEVSCDTEGYRRLRSDTLDRETAEKLLPDRNTLGLVWRYLAGQGDCFEESPACLCRKIVRWSGKALDLGQLLVCLDIFADVGLVQTQRLHKYIKIRLIPTAQKADLNTSRTMQLLQGAINGKFC